MTNRAQLKDKDCQTGHNSSYMLCVKQKNARMLKVRIKRMRKKNYLNKKKAGEALLTLNKTDF